MFILVEYRQLSEEEKAICNKMVLKLQQEKSWLDLDIQILELKLNNWEVTKSKMVQNTKQAIVKLEEQLKNFKNMLDDDFEENKRELAEQITELKKQSISEFKQKIDILHKQLTKGVLVKQEKQEE